MDKTSFCFILESALLNFDGVSFEELTNQYDLSPQLAETGIKLCSYLQSIKFLEIKNDLS